MFARLVLIVSFPKLLFDLLGHDIDGGIKVTFNVLGKEIRAGKRNAHRAGELPFRRLGLVAVEGHSRIDGITVEVFQFADTADDMILNGIGKSHVVWQEDQVHVPMMQSAADKIQ